MGYIEKVMGDNERIIYRTHQHVVVLVEQLLASFFAFLVFLALGLAFLLPPDDDPGNKIRFTIGVIALGSLVMPLYLIVSAWIRGLRRRQFAQRIWRAALAGILICAVALIIMLKPQLKLTGWIAIVVAIVPAFEVIRIFADWLNEQYIITNRRVMEIKGIINKHVRDSALEKVNDVDLAQSFVGRLLGYGTVQIITGSDIGVNRFRRISNPVRFKREMLNAKEQLHEPTPVEQKQESASVQVPVLDAGSLADVEDTPVRANIPDLIVELAELRQKGIISEEEFQTKKKQLLDRL
jgi:hypothetical protein